MNIAKKNWNLKWYLHSLKEEWLCLIWRQFDSIAVEIMAKDQGVFHHDRLGIHQSPTSTTNGQSYGV
jgi:hypothetical protein